jgi:hypothetical protein
LGIKGKQFQRVQMKSEPTAQELLEASIWKINLKEFYGEY